MQLHDSSHEAHRLRFVPKHTFHRAMSYFCRIWWHHARAFFLAFLEPVFQRAEQFCADRRPQLSGALVEPRLFTEYKPRQFAEDKDLQALHQRRSVHWTRGFRCQYFVVPPVDHGVNLWFGGKHRDISPGIRFRRRTISYSVGFTIGSTGARSKFRTIANFSFWTRIWCPVHLKFRKVQKICCFV